MIKRFIIIVGLLLAAVLFWFAFAFWTGLYSVYSIPPSPSEPDGVTYVVAREEAEPLFNSPKHPVPPKKAEEKQTGIGFVSVQKPTRPIDQRIILELPYVQWAFEKSLEPEQ